MSNMSMFKIDALVPVTHLGPVMEQILGIPDARVLDVGLVSIERKAPTPKTITTSKPKKKKRARGEASGMAEEMINAHLATIPAGELFSLSPVKELFGATGAREGSFWWVVRKLMAANKFVKVGRNQYRRLADV